MYMTRKLRTSAHKLFSGPESYRRVDEMRRKFDNSEPVEDSALLASYLDMHNAAITQPILLGGSENVRPFKRKLPGEIALYAQVEGKAYVRAGNSTQRRRHLEANPGDVIEIVGRGRRSIENPLSDFDSLGLLVSIVPVEAVHTEVTNQDAIAALTSMTDAVPELRAQAGLLVEELDREKLSPAAAYEYALRQTPPQ